MFAEAQALEDLYHPAIIRLKDCDYADAARARPYLVMEYFDGMSLDSYVEAEDLLSPADMLAVAVPVAEGLRAAHARGILHRDVKPANVLVRREGPEWRVKLIDFGLALRPTTLEGKASTDGPQAHTTLGKSIAGTLHYAAPEQMGRLEGGQVGAHSDVYGFGKTCYFALLGTPEPDDVERESLPEPWRKFLSRCTGRKVAHRFPDFAAVLSGLSGIQTPATPTDPAATRGSLPNFEPDLKEALEEQRTRGDNRHYFERQGPTRIGAWQAAAQQGDATAQWLLARCLQEGAGVQKDAEAGLAWLRQAADSGLPVAQTDLGDRYYRGQGVEEDASEAFRLYTAAAVQGFPEAYVDLGDCYCEGRGVAENQAEAARHYRMGAEAGWARGQDSLGHCYLKGSGVEHDQPQAARWYRKAAEQGLASAQHNLGWCYEFEKGVKKNWGEAAKWYHKAAEQGIAECQFALGNCYKHGYGVEQDLAQAEQWYRKAAGQGYFGGEDDDRAVKEGKPPDKRGGSRKELTLKVLQRHGLLQQGTEIEPMPDAITEDASKQDPKVLRTNG